MRLAHVHRQAKVGYSMRTTLFAAFGAIVVFAKHFHHTFLVQADRLALQRWIDDGGYRGRRWFADSEASW